MDKKKKKLIIIIACVAAAVILALVLWKVLGGSSSGGRKAFVTRVDSITGSAGSVNRFSGQVVSQDTVSVNKDQDKTVKEILVSQGDEVKKGQTLFTYDQDALELSLEQGQLDVDMAEQNIDALEQQVAELTRARASAPASEQLEYTVQIQTAQNDIRKARYELEQKKLTLESLKKAAGDNTVKSPIDGVIKSINNSDGQDQGDYGYGYGNTDTGFITIMSVGDYRIKGSINEQNVYQISEGDPMIIHSRVDDTVWHGTISKIDRDSNTNSGNENYGYYEQGSGQGETSSSYPFYVEVEDPEGLMMGQHVYMEQDLGQGAARSGLWLMSGYLVQDGEDFYVWAEDGSRLEKRKVAVGDYDEERDAYEILEGLSGSDRIAWPEADLKEGMGTTDNYEEAYPEDYSVDEGQDEFGGEGGEMPEDGEYYEGGEMPEDGGSYEGGEFPENGEMPEDGSYTEDGGMPADEGTVEVNGEGTDGDAAMPQTREE